MTTIKWNGKEYKMPFDADYTRQKGRHIQRRNHCEE